MADKSDFANRQPWLEHRRAPSDFANRKSRSNIGGGFVGHVGAQIMHADQGSIQISNQ
jgi:hypothetical protein